MKLSVRKKIANGLVICLILPRAGASAADLYETYRDGLAGFSAEEQFDLTTPQSSKAEATIKVTGADNPEGADPTGGDPTGGDPTGGDPTGGDPTGGDPTGGDPTGGDPTGGDPTGGPLCEPGTVPPRLIIDAPRLLVTAEDGSADLFKVSMEPDPEFSRSFTFVSTLPEEAKPVPDSVTFGEDACVSKSIWVVGQNDTLVDGDIDYKIEVLDEQGLLVDTLGGVNLDNDNYPAVAVDILGPTALPNGGKGLFTVRASNVSNDGLKNNYLVIQPTDGIEIVGYAASLLSGDALKSKARFKKGALEFKGVNLAAGDALLVTLDVVLDGGGPEVQKITARFIDTSGKQESDNDTRISTSEP